MNSIARLFRALRPAADGSTAGVPLPQSPGRDGIAAPRPREIRAVEVKSGFLTLEEADDWREYFCVVVKVASKDPALVYFETPHDTVPVGKVTIKPKQTRVETLQEMLMIQRLGEKVWFFSASTDADADAWARAIREAHTLRLDDRGRVHTSSSPPAVASHTPNGSIQSPGRGSVRPVAGSGGGASAAGAPAGGSPARVRESRRASATSVGSVGSRGRTASHASHASHASQRSHVSTGSFAGGAGGARGRTASSGSGRRREANAAAVFTLHNGNGHAHGGDPASGNGLAVGEGVRWPVTKLPHHPYDAFKHMFVLSTDEDMRNAITWGCLRGSPLRSLCWKVFLGCVPTSCGISAWGEYLRYQRRGYERLRRKHMLGSDKDAEAWLADVASEDKEVSRRAARKWLRYRAKRELQGYIKKDIHRTFGDIMFFRRKEVQDMLLRVLQVWALAHPSLSYKQGMNELLAVVIMLLFTETQLWDAACADSDFQAVHVRELVGTLRDPEYMEHDAYLMLDQVMRRLFHLYSPSKSNSPKRQFATDPLDKVVANATNGSSDSSDTGSEDMDDPQTDPRVKRSPLRRRRRGSQTGSQDQADGERSSKHKHRSKHKHKHKHKRKHKHKHKHRSRRHSLENGSDSRRRGGNADGGDTEGGGHDSAGLSTSPADATGAADASEGGQSNSSAGRGTDAGSGLSETPQIVRQPMLTRRMSAALAAGLDGRLARVAAVIGDEASPGSRARVYASDEEDDDYDDDGDEDDGAAVGHVHVDDLFAEGQAYAKGAGHGSSDSHDAGGAGSAAKEAGGATAPPLVAGTTGVDGSLTPTSPRPAPSGVLPPTPPTPASPATPGVARPSKLPPRVVAPPFARHALESSLNLTMSPAKMMKQPRIRRHSWARRASIKELSALGALSDSDDRGNSPGPPHDAVASGGRPPRMSGTRVRSHTAHARPAPWRGVRGVVAPAATAVRLRNGDAGDAEDDGTDVTVVVSSSLRDTPTRPSTKGAGAGDASADTAVDDGSAHDGEAGGQADAAPGDSPPGPAVGGDGTTGGDGAGDGESGAGVAAVEDPDESHLAERARQQEEMGYNSVSFDWTKSLPPSKLGSLMDRLDNIQGKLLSWVDPELAAHLERLEVCPPMFMLRWLRLAFVREFSVATVWALWDAVLAQSPDDFELLDYTCVAVLMAIREPLLAARDAPAALGHLTGGVLSFASIDMSQVIARAMDLRRMFGADLAKLQQRQQRAARRENGGSPSDDDGGDTTRERRSASAGHGASSEPATVARPRSSTAPHEGELAGQSPASAAGPSGSPAIRREHSTGSSAQGDSDAASESSAGVRSFSALRALAARRQSPTTVGLPDFGSTGDLAVLPPRSLSRNSTGSTSGGDSVRAHRRLPTETSWRAYTRRGSRHRLGSAGSGDTGPVSAAARRARHGIGVHVHLEGVVTPVAAAPHAAAATAHVQGAGPRKPGLS